MRNANYGPRQTLICSETCHVIKENVTEFANIDLKIKQNKLDNVLASYGFAILYMLLSLNPHDKFQ